MRSNILLLATAGFVAADTANLFLPAFDAQSLVAKSIGSDSAATTYVLGCPSNADSADCGVPYPIVLVQGPKTVAYTIHIVDSEDDDGGDFSYDQELRCSLGGTTVADCTQIVTGAILTNTAGLIGDTSLQSSDHAVVSGTQLDGVFQTVTIVTDTASILNYGTGVDGSKTTYGGVLAVETGAGSSTTATATETGMVTSKATLSSQTGVAASVSSKASSVKADASAAASASSTGFAAQVTGLGAFAAAAVAGVMAMAAL